MRRKLLTDFARTFCDMFAENERYPYDAELVRRGPGTLVLDALNATATHNGVPIDLARLVARLHDWLGARSAEHPGIYAQIERAALTAVYRVKPDKSIPGGYPLWRLEFDCVTEIVAGGRTYAHTTPGSFRLEPTGASANNLRVAIPRAQPDAQ